MTIKVKTVLPQKMYATWVFARQPTTKTISSEEILRTGGRLEIASQTGQIERVLDFASCTSSDFKVRKIRGMFVSKEKKAGQFQS